MAKGMRFALETHRHDDVDDAIRDLASEVRDLKMELKFYKESQRNNQGFFNGGPLETFMTVSALQNFGRR